jgi:uncharacterized delta-60 repeat protein
MKITVAVLVALLGAPASHAATDSPFLDTTYGSAGVAHFGYDLGNGNYDIPQAAVILDDGSLMVAGYAYDAHVPLSSPIVAMRFLTNGTIDTEFGVGNVVQLPSFAGGGVADLALISDGNVAAIGEYTSDGETVDLIVGRIGGNGTPDTSFNFSGFRGISPGTFGPTLSQVHAKRVLALSDGKLLGLGFATDNLTTACAAVVRINPDGSFDTTFASTGKACYTTDVTTKPFFYAFDMALQSDGKIVVVGEGNHGNVADNGDMAVLRLLADGSVDTTFGSDGWAFVAFDLGSDLSDAAEAVSIDASGRILIVGSSSSATGSDLVAARLLATGQIDTSFGAAGRLDVPTTYTFEPSVAVLQDGRILVVANGNSGRGQFGAFMFKNNGNVDSSFGIDGFYTQSVAGYALAVVPRLIGRGDYFYLPCNATSSTDSSDSEFGVTRLIQPIFADGFDGNFN